MDQGRPVAAIQPWMRGIAHERWYNRRVVGPILGRLGDEFQRNRDPGGVQVDHAAAIGFRLANGAIIGVFAAVPLPLWVIVSETFGGFALFELGKHYTRSRVLVA